MRIALEKPDRTLFTTELDVRVTDLNYANHLANDKLLCFAQQARVELFKQWGYSELNFAGMGIIMADAAIVFQAQSYLGDRLKIEIGVKDIARVSFDLYYQFSNCETGEQVALVKTAIICFDYNKQKVASIPAQIKQHLVK